MTQTKLEKIEPRKIVSKTRGYKENEAAYNYWLKNPHINLTEVCNIHNMTDSKLRSWLKTYDKPRPDFARAVARESRQDWIVRAYNKGLAEGLTAREVSNWASKGSGTHIQRGDVQHYAGKFDLPLLTEFDNGSHIGKTSKYA